MMNQDNNIKIGQIEISSRKAGANFDADDLPLLLTRDLVLFPGVVFPISLGREKSIKVATEAAERDLTIGIVCQLNPDNEDPAVPDEVFDYGVTATVLNILDLPDGTKTAIVHSDFKFHITGAGAGLLIPGEPSAAVQVIKEPRPRISDKEFVATVQLIKDTTTRLIQSQTDGPNDLVMNLKQIDDPTILVNMVATHAPIEADTKVSLLSLNRIKERALALLGELSRGEQMASIMQSIRERTKQRISEQQRSAFLQNQIDVMRDELYGEDKDEIAQLKERSEKVNFPEEVKKTFEKEVEKLSRLNPQSPDYSVQYSYLTMLLELPWNNPKPVSTDFAKAEEILDTDHYGLEKVKERVLEQLAVMMNTPDGKSPIICLVGAPGVGKTSLGQSIAAALGRDYRRVSLGGLHDESEIRGHRRTYIGAMPGRIIDAMRRTGSSNPVLLLDEIDKIGNDFRGDPSAALLEVLDPEQNCHFHDNYVDVDYDLSRVMFIATANTLSTVAQPLLDRMEIIDMSGYLLEEKVEIARRHLIPRALKANGFEADEIEFSTEAIVKIVESYTAESGVRKLEKEIERMVRKIVLDKMRGHGVPRTIDASIVRQMLGVEKFSKERYEADPIPGVATGLAWTAVGGEILFIETSVSPSKAEKLTLTGNLGDVMKESATIALQYVKAHAVELGIDSEKLEASTLHLHVPEGAIPKDGPSAGITMATAMVSLLTGRPLKSRLAMTGEITLRGKVLPVGGIKEKILAAKRAGITDIILSEDNRKDIEDIKPVYLEGLEFHYVKTVMDVISIALQARG